MFDSQHGVVVGGFFRHGLDHIPVLDDFTVIDTKDTHHGFPWIWLPLIEWAIFNNIKAPRTPVSGKTPVGAQYLRVDPAAIRAGQKGHGTSDVIG